MLLRLCTLPLGENKKTMPKQKHYHRTRPDGPGEKLFLFLNTFSFFAIQLNISCFVYCVNHVSNLYLQVEITLVNHLWTLRLNFIDPFQIIPIGKFKYASHR